MEGRSFIGTSGWSYDHWNGVFYPPAMKAGERLMFYINHFDTVEVNNTFYHLPSAATFEGWKEAAPDRFLFALKGSRYITHMKKLRDAGQSLELFLGRASILGSNLGPVLFQLPPNWKCNPGRLKIFTEMLPTDVRFAFEFRDPSWFNSEVYEILTDGGFALCLYHMPGFETPHEVTAPFVYIRFHGSGVLYGGRYPAEDLERWAAGIKDCLTKGLDVYAYFNNDAFGNAVFNAKELKKMVEGSRPVNGKGGV